MYRIAIALLLPIFRLVSNGGAGLAQPPREHAGTEYQETEPAELRRDALEAFRSSAEFGKTWVKEQPNDQFVECEFGEIGGGALRELFWIIKDDARPRVRAHPKYPVQLAAGVALDVRVAASHTQEQDDLVEFRWRYQGRAIRVVASANAFKVDLDLRELWSCRQSVQAPACVLEARNWVGDVLKLEGAQPGGSRPIPYRVDLPWPEKLSDGVEFYSGPEQNIMRLRGWPQWFDRVDVFVEDGVLSVLIYRSIGQLATSFRDGSKWFPDDFRAEVHERARNLPGPSSTPQTDEK